MGGLTNHPYRRINSALRIFIIAIRHDKKRNEWSWRSMLNIIIHIYGRSVVQYNLQEKGEEYSFYDNRQIIYLSPSL